MYVLTPGSCLLNDVSALAVCSGATWQSSYRLGKILSITALYEAPLKLGNFFTAPLARTTVSFFLSECEESGTQPQSLLAHAFCFSVHWLLRLMGSLERERLNHRRKYLLASTRRNPV